MKRQLKLGISAVSMAAGLLLSGCGDGTTGTNVTENETVESTSVEIVAEPLLSATESAIREYELKYCKGEMTQEDYHALADLYGKNGQVKLQRDMLEESYRLFDDQEALEKLQGIAVNLAEEEDEIAREGSLMLQNLELDEYLDESINLITAPEWIQTMMPKLFEGKRTYFITKDDRVILTIEVGYDANGNTYSNIWFAGADDAVKVLQYQNNAVQLLQTKYKDGNYDGEFTLWNCDGNTGAVICQKGTFSAGAFHGEFEERVHTGDAAGDLYALWCNRETLEYTEYLGNFDEAGKTTLEQPTEQQMKALVGDAAEGFCQVYAYDSSKKKCLFTLLAKESAESYAFTATGMGVPAFTEPEIYKVKN
ncbi:MAG: hypothetical protein K6G30_07550, partial [Acetatifactor sp.]|nr:hypothetical protein [Acetatifactor sp.]